MERNTGSTNGMESKGAINDLNGECFELNSSSFCDLEFIFISIILKSVPWYSPDS